MPRSAGRYVAVTRARDSWYVELIGEEGETREEVTRQAVHQIERDSPAPDDARANLIVTAYSTALRTWYTQVRQYEAARAWAARRYGGEAP